MYFNIGEIPFAISADPMFPSPYCRKIFPISFCKLSSADRDSPFNMYSVILEGKAMGGGWADGEAIEGNGRGTFVRGSLNGF